MRLRAARHLLLAALVAALAACETAPPAFRSQSTLSAPERIATPGPRAPVAVLAIEGAEGVTLERLRGMVAAALRDAGVPARTDSPSARSFRLGAEIRREATALAADKLFLRWRLIDPYGIEAGAVEQVKRAPAGAWEASDAALVAFLAQDAAARIAPFYRRALRAQGKAPLAPVFVAPVDGIAGDGRRALTAAMRAALSVEGISLADDFSAETYLVLGALYLPAAAASSGEILWTLIEPDGHEIAVVSQQGISAAAAGGALGSATVDAVAADAAPRIAAILRAAGPVATPMEAE